MKPEHEIRAKIAKFQAPPLWRALDDYRAAPAMELALMWPLIGLALADAWLGAKAHCACAKIVPNRR